MGNIKNIIGSNCRINADNEIGTLITAFNPMYDVLTIHRYGNKKQEDTIANIVVDSLNTANKCGKLPSQLLQENEEMKAMLLEVFETLKNEGFVETSKNIKQLLTKLNQ